MAENGDGKPRIIRGDPPGALRVAMFCDESGIGGDSKHYAFGMLVMWYQRRGQLSGEIQALREKHRRMEGEIKWQNCNRYNLQLYKALVDHFFRASWLRFHCMLVNRKWVNLQKFHDGDIDLARRKHFTELLGNKIGTIKRVSRGRVQDFRVYVDKLPSRYRKAAETAGIIAGHRANQILSLHNIAVGNALIDFLKECDSKDQLGIQICDLLLGAITDTWNQASTNPAKAELKLHIAEYLGWNDLRSDTKPDERKFNVWWLTDKFGPGERPVETRDVHLRFPLPPIKIYRPSQRTKSN